MAYHLTDVDYFGYFKKTALTIHNLIMIERGNLPIHGAMAKIDLKSGKSAHVVIVGDSGAGKSESLEAFRVLADQYIRQLTVVFDDMGSLEHSPKGRGCRPTGRKSGPSSAWTTCIRDTPIRKSTGRFS